MCQKGLIKITLTGPGTEQKKRILASIMVKTVDGAESTSLNLPFCSLAETGDIL
jgi:hypothetical protein